jgi:hypothetical protein
VCVCVVLTCDFEQQQKREGGVTGGGSENQKKRLGAREQHAHFSLFFFSSPPLARVRAHTHTHARTHPSLSPCERARGVEGRHAALNRSIDARVRESEKQKTSPASSCSIVSRLVCERFIACVRKGTWRRAARGRLGPGTVGSNGGAKKNTPPPGPRPQPRRGCRRHTKHSHMLFSIRRHTHTRTDRALCR